MARALSTTAFSRSQLSGEKIRSLLVAGREQFRISTGDAIKVPIPGDGVSLDRPFPDAQWGGRLGFVQPTFTRAQLLFPPLVFIKYSEIVGASSKWLTEVHFPGKSGYQTHSLLPGEEAEEFHVSPSQPTELPFFPTSASENDRGS